MTDALSLLSLTEFEFNEISKLFDRKHGDIYLAVEYSDGSKREVLVETFEELVSTLVDEITRNPVRRWWLVLDP